MQYTLFTVNKTVRGDWQATPEYAQTKTVPGLCFPQAKIPSFWV